MSKDLGGFGETAVGWYGHRVGTTSPVAQDVCSVRNIAQLRGHGRPGKRDVGDGSLRFCIALLLSRLAGILRVSLLLYGRFLRCNFLGIEARSPQ
jgi:hypothetical protein